jgi:hypothetical protein
MASPDQQIPASAGFQVNQEKESKSENDRGESIQNHNDEGAQETKLVNIVFCSQGDQDTSQSQAHVLQAEKSSVPKAQTDIDRGESIQNHNERDVQMKMVVESSSCSQADQASFQPRAHVPQDEKSSKPKDQEGEDEKKSNGLDKDSATLSLAFHLVPQSPNLPQEATSPLPQAQVPQAEEHRPPVIPPNPCGSLQNPPAASVQANKATMPSFSLRLTANPPP